MIIFIVMITNSIPKCCTLLPILILGLARCVGKNNTINVLCWHISSPFFFLFNIVPRVSVMVNDATFLRVAYC